MVKITSSGNYLKADQVKKGSVVKFLSEGEYVKSTKYTYEDGSPKISFEVKVTYEGEEKILRMNKASRVAMVEGFGDETKDWIGKQATLFIMPTPNGDNKMIVVDPVIENIQPSPVNQDDIAWDK